MDPSTQLRYKALGNTIRMAVVADLYMGWNSSAADFAAQFDVSLPAMMRHLSILESAGLIYRKKISRRNVCYLNSQALTSMPDWQNILDIGWMDTIVIDSRLPDAPKPRTINQ